MERNINEELLQLASSDQAFTDILIQTDKPVMLKTPRGWTEAPNFDPLFSEETHLLLDNMEPKWRDLLPVRAISRALNLSSCRLRINAYRMNGGGDQGISIRRQPLKPPQLTEIGVPMFIRKEIEKGKGLVIVTGQTGSGKTTTLASMLQYINATKSAHVITIEDPIEYIHDRDKAIFSQKEVPTDVPTFAEGLHDALRQKPDVILVGEIREKEAADVAMLAAESGLLVLASMHTNKAEGAISKLLNWFPGETQQRAKMLSDSLLMILCQSLIPTLDGTGWVLANETLVNSGPQTANMIADPSKHAQLHDFMKRGTDQMSQVLNKDLARLVRDKKITPQAAMDATNNKLDLTDQIGGQLLR